MSLYRSSPVVIAISSRLSWRKTRRRGCINQEFENVARLRRFHLDFEQNRMDNNERFTAIAICSNRQRSLKRHISIRFCQEIPANGRAPFLLNKAAWLAKIGF